MPAALGSALLLACLGLAAGLEQLNVTVRDEARGRDVQVSICFTSEPAPQDLYLFAHGGGLFAGDYAYLCSSAPGVVARLISPSTDDPMDLRPMAEDLRFLSKSLPLQSTRNASSPLFGVLTARVLLTGHSMGGAAALLAGLEAPPGVAGVVAIAPGFWGPQQVEVLRGIRARGADSRLCGLPLLQLAGDQDCANSLALQGLPIWGNVTAGCERAEPRALAVVKGATHCQWASPAVGTCDFDRPCPAPRLAREEQQDLGRKLLAAVGRGALAEELLRQKATLSYVDEHSAPSDVAQLKSYCPCGTSVMQF